MVILVSMLSLMIGIVGGEDIWCTSVNRGVIVEWEVMELKIMGVRKFEK